MREREIRHNPHERKNCKIWEWEKLLGKCRCKGFLLEGVKSMFYASFGPTLKESSHFKFIHITKLNFILLRKKYCLWCIYKCKNVFEFNWNSNILYLSFALYFKKKVLTSDNIQYDLRTQHDFFLV